MLMNKIVVASQLILTDNDYIYGEVGTILAEVLMVTVWALTK